MPASRRSRGSVLLLAIGLLTIVAILASTFLIVSNLDAQETEVLMTKAQSDPTAQGGLSRVQFCLAMDKWADDTGPYGKVGENVDGWKKYIDGPGDPNERIDRWLAGVFDRTKSNPTSPYSELFEETAKEDVDIDGDDLNDAKLYPCFPNADANERESNFYQAVRIVDLSGKVGINTAGKLFLNGDMTWKTDDENWPDLMAPCLIQLPELLGQPVGEAAYAEIHESRCSEVPNVLLKTYYQDCARRLLAPRKGYNPFPIGDEAFLLWCDKLGKDALTTEQEKVLPGRLAKLLTGDLIQLNQSDPNGTRGDEMRRLLTTFSCTTDVVRNPGDGLEDYKWLRGDHEELYNQMLGMLTRLELGKSDAERKKMAAHFVANLEAYVSPGREGFPWAFTPEAESGLTVYGLKQDIVITEAVAKHPGPTDDKKNDWARGYAIEIMNPSLSQIDLGEDYELRINGTKVGDLSGTLGGQPEHVSLLSEDTLPKLVFYDYVKGEGCKVEAAEFFNATDMKNWTKVNGLDLSKGGSTKLEIVCVSGGEEVTVDLITTGGDGLKYTGAGDPNDPNSSDSSTPSNPVFRSIRRDDRVRKSSVADGHMPLTNYNLAYYMWYKEDNEHTLGTANGLSDNTEIQGLGKLSDAYGAPIHQAERVRDDLGAGGTKLLLDGLGDLCNIYLCGPVKGEGGFPQRIIRETEAGPIFADTPARGRLPFCPNFAGAPQVTSDGYPDVPVGCFFAEFFTAIRPHTQIGEGERKEKGRIYGRINVNTAPRDVLMCLPWPTKVLRLGRREVEVAPISGEKYYNVDPRLAVDALIKYRQSGGQNQDVNAGVENLRKESPNVLAFLTPGEVAIPLAAYMDTVIVTEEGGTQLELRKHPDYIRRRHALYKAVANCITTRSDTFAVYIEIRYRASGRFKWNYMAVLDRSNVRTYSDTPAVLLFTEVK